MALVESLLTAMVRADGDALVMHVGERPYVVTGSGTLDLSTQNLNLDAMTGMLQQLLPTSTQDSLEEFGAVEHRLPPHGDDTFTVVAARGGDDIWIEIRRRRHAAVAAVSVPAPVVAPMVAEPPPLMAPIAVVAPEAEQPQTVAVALAHDHEPTVDVAPVPLVEPAVHADPEPIELRPAVAAAMAEAPLPVETVTRLEPELVADALPVMAEVPASREEAAFAVETVTPVSEEPLPLVATMEAAEPVAAEEPANVEIPTVETVATAEALVPVAIESPPLVAMASAPSEAPALAEELAPDVAALDPVEEPASRLDEQPVVAEAPAISVRRPQATLVDELPALEDPSMAEDLPVSEDRQSIGSDQNAGAPEDLSWTTSPETTQQAAAVASIDAASVAGSEDLSIGGHVLHETDAATPTPVTPVAWEAPVAFASSAVQDAPAAPDTPAAFESPAASEAPDAPAAPEAPDAPEAPEVTDRPRVLQMTRTVRIEVPPRGAAVRGTGLERLLRLASARSASALFVISDTRPSIRVEGELRPLDGEAPMSRADVESALMELVPEATRDAVSRGESAEWFADFADLGRVRCITFTDHRGPGVVFRLFATRVATAEQLGLSREVQALATEPQGLVLVAGRPGSGKSTLVSALVDLVSHQRAEYIVTLERQIRLVHDNHAAIVSQREIRGGVEEALTAARAALREDPDVLVVDDLTSGPMVPLLLQAAAEGLVFVSITAPSTVEAVERFVDLASADMRAGVQAAMAESFRGAVAQVLLKKTGGGRIAAREVLLATAEVTRLISEGAPGQLQSALEGGRKHGMVPLFDAVAGLVQSGVVDVREAFRKSPDRGQMLAGLKREGIDTTFVERLA